jgi:hypothetical protein
MKKILFFTLVIAFYLITQLNFTGYGSTGKKTCDDIKLTSKKCFKMLEQHQSKVKQIDKKYKKSDLNYTVSLTAENSAFVENYQIVMRDSETVKGDSDRNPANACQGDEGSALKSCLEDAQKIYNSLVPN